MGKGFMHKLMSILLSVFLMLVFSPGFFGSALAQSRKSKSDPEVMKIEQVLKDWNASYKFNRNTEQLLADNLELVIEAQVFLRRSDLDSTLKTQLENYQGAALKKIISDDKVALPYIIRDYARTIRAMNQKENDLDAEIKKVVSRRWALRLEALEAAIKSIGLPAIPPLTDFQTLAAKNQAKLLSVRISSLVIDVVQRGQKDLEKAEGENRNRERAQKEIFPHSTAVSEAEPRELPRLGTEGPAGEGRSRDVIFEDPKARHINQ